MRLRYYQSRLMTLLKQRNGYFGLNVALIALCLLLGVSVALLIGYAQNHARIYLVPPHIEQPFWLSNHAPSAQYLSEMSAYLVQLRLTVTPDNIGYQQKLLLRYSDPNDYTGLKEQLSQEAQIVEQAQMSTSFYPIASRVDEKSLSVSVEGDFHRYLQGEALEPERQHYLISYRYQLGRLWIAQFQQENDIDDE